MKRTDTDTNKNTKRDILEASLMLFSQRGYKGATMREISNQANISLGLTYTYFKNKEEILSSLLLEFIDGRRRLFKSVLQNPDSEKLTSIDVLTLMIKDIQQHKEEFRLYAQLMLQPQTSTKLMEVKRTLQNFHSEESKFVQQVNQQFKAKPKIPAELFKVIITGLMFLHLHRDDFDTDQALKLASDHLQR